MGRPEHRTNQLELYEMVRKRGRKVPRQGATCCYSTFMFLGLTLGIVFLTLSVTFLVMHFLDEKPKDGINTSNETSAQPSYRQSVKNKPLHLPSLSDIRNYISDRFTGNQNQGDVKDTRKRFTFDDMYGGKFYPDMPNLQWIQGTDLASFFLNGSLMIYNSTSNSTYQLANSTQTPNIVDLASVQFSADMNYVQFVNKVNQVNSRKVLFRYSIYELKNLNEPYGGKVIFPTDPTLRDKGMRSFEWGPSGSALYFVQGGNLYYQASVRAQTVALTTDGGKDGIEHGVRPADWGLMLVGVNEGFSPDGRFIVFNSFNNSDVPNFNMPIYGDNMRRYVKIDSFLYAKAGVTKIFSKGTLYIVDVTNPGVLLKFDPPKEFANAQHYFWQVTWRTTTTLLVSWANRRQNRSIVTLCSTETQQCDRHSEESINDGWIDTNNRQLIFINDGENYLTLLPKEEGITGKWRHIALVSSSMGEEGTITFLTSGQEEVTQLVKFDPEKEVVYYLSTGGDPYSRKLYRVGTPSASDEFRAPRCLTCSLCGTVSSVSFSDNRKFYALTCGGPGVPEERIYNVETGENILFGNDYDRVRALRANTKLPTIEYIQLKVGGGYTANAELVLPPGVDRSGNKKYPVLIYTYGGPQGHQQSDYNYRYYSSSSSFESYLASSHDVITARIDGRGSGGRGFRYLYELNNKLAVYEIEDQILGAQSLKDSYPFVDGDRIAIWGWSYGGFTTSHVIGHPSDVIKCGMAVAPVINYRLYYTAYTERFSGLDTKEDNKNGYDITDCTRKAENFRGKQYLIAHGTADDNVHFQNAIQMINSLTDREIQFQTQVYVDQDHSIGDRPHNRHLFRAMTNFLLNKCFSVNSNSIKNRSAILSSPSVLLSNGVV